MPTDTFPIAADADDGGGNKTGPIWANIPAAGYNVSDAATDPFLKSLFAGDYYVGNLFFRWDTSSIPDDATITAANVLLFCSDKASPDALSFAADYYDFGGEPSVDADWEYSSSGNAITSIALNSLTIGAVNTIALTSLTGISKTGFTGLRFAPFNTTAPTGDNFADIAMREHATNQEPRLEVTYTLSSLAQMAWVTTL